MGLFERGGTAEIKSILIKEILIYMKALDIQKYSGSPGVTSKTIGGPVVVRHGFSLEKASTNNSEIIF